MRVEICQTDPSGFPMPQPEPLIAMMPMKKNVPEPGNNDWQLTTCPKCGQECWYQKIEADIAKQFMPEITFLCTECALKEYLHHEQKEPSK